MRTYRGFVVAAAAAGIAFTQIGCAAPTVDADMRLTEVRRPEEASEQWGDYEIEEAEDGLAYEDDLVRVVTIPTNGMFVLNIENKTDHSVQLIWDRASFVGTTGSSSKVTSGDTRVMDVGQSQTPTPIPANASTTVTAIPNAVIYDNDGDGVDDVNPLFAASDSTEFDEHEGETARLIVPLEVEDTVNEYTFVFEVRDLQVQE